MDPGKIGRNKNEKEFLKDMFKYQSAVELEDENSGIRESNVSGYATGNN